MIRISQLKLSVTHTSADLKQAVLKKLRISDTELLDYSIVKQSLDCRDKTYLRMVLTLDVHLRHEKAVLSKLHDPNVIRTEPAVYQYPEPGQGLLEHPPVVIGSGPAGLFAAYLLAEKGYRPVIVERGEPVEERAAKVRLFWETGILDPESNIQFGEGGAGTFSDGKLNTGVKDPLGRKDLMLKIFADHGAPRKILYQNKPHLGTDVLVRIMASMRKQILEWGGTYRFSTLFREFEIRDGHVTGIKVQDPSGTFLIPAECVILAIGHSARDTFDYLIRRSPLTVIAKPFAVGVRVEHRQSDINLSQYGSGYPEQLPAADYKLTCHTASGRSVYSFCMCPGGYVVNSSSLEGHQCINGMSYSGRSSENANSAIVAAVKPSEDPEENIRFQMEIERKAYLAGKGKIISQRLEDFEKQKVSSDFGAIRPVHKGLTAMADINEVLPEDICSDIREAIHIFGTRIRGFDDPDVILSAVESRTSSPVRICRKENMESDTAGIFPTGEGAGYGVVI